MMTALIIHRPAACAPAHFIRFCTRASCAILRECEKTFSILLFYRYVLFNCVNITGKCFAKCGPAEVVPRNSEVNGKLCVCVAIFVTIFGWRHQTGQMFWSFQFWCDLCRATNNLEVEYSVDVKLVEHKLVDRRSLPPVYFMPNPIKRRPSQRNNRSSGVNFFLQT